VFIFPYGNIVRPVQQKFGRNYGLANSK